MADKIAILDIEMNGLLETHLDYSSFPYKFKPSAKIWVVVVRDLKTGEDWYKEKEKITLEWLKSVLAPFDYIVAHHGIKFDFPALMLFNLLEYRIGYLNESDTCFGKPITFLDTHILSRLSNPDRPAHSLAYWGKKTGELKDDYRKQCIEEGYIKASDPKGAEFMEWNPLMLPYCRQDCKANAKAFNLIIKEFVNHNWKQSVKQEHKLADLAIRREHLGFDFDKDLAVKCVEELNEKLQELSDKVLPLIPKKPLNQTELSYWTPPKTQVKKDGNLSKHMINFIEKIGAEETDLGFKFEGVEYNLPYTEPLREFVAPEMKDFDHIKMYLIKLGWEPIEWSERDMTKDSKKKNLSYEKRLDTLDRWWKKAIEKEIYKEHKLAEARETLRMHPNSNEEDIYEKFKEKLKEKFPVRVYTSPKIKVGVEKELCPNLVKLGEKVEFAKYFAQWLTYRHRRNSIAGGDLEDLDLEEDAPTSGFLSTYREEDGRVPTPSIEIGAVTNRYTHIGVANIPRPSSEYGKEMRSLFRAGKGAVFFGFDYASLEARIMAHYVHRYPKGVELGKQFIADKPDDWHTSQANAMGISRTDAKSVDYGLIYGAQIKKLMKMLGVSEERAKEIYSMFWDNSPALRDLRDAVTTYWTNTGKKFVLGMDGRKIIVRSKHALLNSLFQSAGVIYAKYVTVLHAQKMEKEGYCIDPFKGKPDICSMIEYHDEQDMYVNPKLFKFQKFKTKEEGEEFIRTWRGSQLSALSEGKDCFYVALPSKVSEGIEETMREVTELLNIKVDMGFEYMLGNSWYECH